MLLSYWALLLIFDNVTSVNSQDVDVVTLEFIADVARSFFPGTRVSANLCISKDGMINLSRKLSRYRVIHDIQNSFKELPTPLYDNIEHRNLYLLDLNCPRYMDILLMANISGMFIAPAKWLIFHDRRDSPITTDEAIREIFKDIAVYPDSDVLLGRRAHGDVFQLISIYRPSPYRDVILEDRGNWSNAKGVLLKDRRVASERRRNLHLTPLRACLVMTNPDTINHLTDYRDKHVDPVTKVDYPTTLMLMKRINATVNFIVTNSWGYLNENGSWSGMTGMFQRDEIDFAGTASFLVKERMGLVNYVQLYTKTSSRFIFRQPLLSSVSNILTLPFERSVWLAIGGFLILVIFLLQLSMKWEHNRGFSGTSAAYYKQLDRGEPTLSDNFLIILGAVAQQGFSYEAYRVPSRIVTLMLLIASLSLYASYTANIVALLQSTTDAIKTVPDLFYSPLKLGAHDVIYSRHYFKAFEEPIRKTILERINKRNLWLSVDEGIDRLRKELFAFHVETGAAYKIIQETYQEEEKCGLTEIDYLNHVYPLRAIKKQSPYLEIFKNGALKIRESGLQKLHESRLYTKKPQCHAKLNFISIGFAECYFALVTMGSGFACTIIVFLLEILWSRTIGKKRGNSMKKLRSINSENYPAIDE